MQRRERESRVASSGLSLRMDESFVQAKNNVVQEKNQFCRKEEAHREENRPTVMAKNNGRAIIVFQGNQAEEKNRKNEERKKKDVRKEKEQLKEFVWLTTN